MKSLALRDVRHFCPFFAEKVASIRALILPSLFILPYSEASQVFNSFSLISQSDLLRTINGMKSSSSVLDVLPIRLLKQFLLFLHLIFYQHYNLNQSVLK